MSAAIRAGYKQTEVGVIPGEWKASPLKGNVAIAHGFPFASEYFASHGPYRLTTPGHFYEEGGFKDIGEKQKYYVGSVPIDYVLEPGDLVVAMTEQADGLLGSAAVMPNLGGYLHNQRLGRVKKLTSAIDLSFLLYVFNSPSYRAKVRETAAGTKVKHTSPEKLLEISVRLPPLAEQRAIAAALSDVDALLAKLDEFIAKKRDLKQAAMQQLLTGQTRLSGFSGEWEVKRLGDVAHIKTGAKNNDDKVEDGEFPLFVRSQTVERISGYSYDCEAILVPGEGGIGSIFHYINGKFDCHQRVYKISAFNADTCGKFVFFCMKHLFHKQASRNSVKATVDSLRLPTFLEFEFNTPALEEQKAIVEILSDMDSELSALEARRDKTRALKQGMMQELLTGRIRLV